EHRSRGGLAVSGGFVSSHRRSFFGRSSTGDHQPGEDRGRYQPMGEAAGKVGLPFEPGHFSSGCGERTRYRTGKAWHDRSGDPEDGRNTREALIAYRAMRLID